MPTLSSEEAACLLRTVQQLSYVREMAAVTEIVSEAARHLVVCEGVTFVLRDDNHCFYTDENAIAPLWKGQRFPVNACVSGWAMLHRESVVIEDVFADPRVPHDVYRRTFVKSMVMVPIRIDDPLGAIGAYWAKRHLPSAHEVALLEVLADSAASAVANVELYRRLTDAVRLREEFITIASHELRTPLTPLHLSLDGAFRAVQAGQPSDDVVGRLQRARGFLDRAEQVVDSLVAQIGLWNDRLRLEPRPTELGALVKAIVDRFRSAVRTRTDIDLHLPDGAVVGSWDAERLDQAISGLVDNAIKFGEGKSVSVRVEGGPGLPARVLVTDQGRGIAPGDQARIFQRFERAQDARNFAGFGLGLWTAQRIAGAHGGTVRVQSEPGKGATFTLELPAAAPDAG
jgi:two-component system CheB/CheR fusion protein